jgi:hypothetical protein
MKFLELFTTETQLSIFWFLKQGFFCVWRLEWPNSRGKNAERKTLKANKNISFQHCASFSKMINLMAYFMTKN